MPVAKPRWTGANGEMAVIVSRGEPRRSNLEMEQAVAEQIADYLPHHTKLKVGPMVRALTVQLIAEDYITPDGSHAVTLTREHLFAYVQVALTQLGELEESERER